MTSTPLDSSTRLAVDRTRLAHERTLMAWVRTATSMISFGFSIYKFFQVRDGQPGSGLIGPRGFAILMISIGLTALVLATIEHRRAVRAMRVEYRCGRPVFTRHPDRRPGIRPGRVRPGDGPAPAMSPAPPQSLLR